MTTARDRYEAKTRVVTFRVPSEVYDQLEDVKARTGLSYADLVKLGAGIARGEIKTKLAEISGLRKRLAELTAALGEVRQRLNQSLEGERRRRLGELDAEMQAFRLFDRGWRVEVVSSKLDISLKTANHYFDEWAKGRGRQRGRRNRTDTKMLEKTYRYPRRAEAVAWGHVRIQTLSSGGHGGIGETNRELPSSPG